MQREREQSTPPEPRRKYEPPRVEQTGSFERLVLACGMAPAGKGACGVNPFSG